MGSMHPSALERPPATAQERQRAPHTATAPTPRDRRSRALTYTAFGAIVAVYLVALTQAARLLPEKGEAWSMPAVVWGGIAAACCVVAAILFFCRAFQVTIAGRATASSAPADRRE